MTLFGQEESLFLSIIQNPTMLFIRNKHINYTLQGKCSYKFSGMGKHKQACLAPAYLFAGALACVQPP